MQASTINTAYKACLQEAQNHYENFPTATRLVAQQHRNATAAIYSFARRADDIADENPQLDDEQRLQQLDCMLVGLNSHLSGEQNNDHTFLALSDTIRRYDLPILPFEKLIRAFSMDVSKKRFSSFDEILYYCEHSANPIGELILRLHDCYSEQTRYLSDQICTALQIINFMQDIEDDYLQRDRIYIPLDELQRAGITESVFKQRQSSEALEQLVHFQIKRATQMLINGAALTQYLSGRLQLVIRLTILGGLRVSEKLIMRKNVYERPVLGRQDWLLILARSLYFRYYVTHANFSQSDLE